MSTLLEQASLVLIPSGYKEDTVYSVIPSNGSGDMSFTRASDGTRINSDGLVENTPWNILTYSQDFTNASWSKSGVTITPNTTVAPNGTTTASKIVEDGTLVTYGVYKGITNGFRYSHSIYAKKAERDWIKVNAIHGSNQSVWFNLANGTIGTNNTTGTPSIENVGNGWYRCTINNTSHLSASSFYSVMPCTNNNIETYTGTIGSGIFIWGAQLDLGSTAKPYFPTTDRLNVPRLTYQNGGGGCPSLLLEPQRTNVYLYSSDFSNAAWLKSNCTQTPNFSTSVISGINATKIDFTTIGFLNQTTSFVGNTTASIYVIVKADTLTKFRLVEAFYFGNFVEYDLVNETATGTGGFITDLGNGWFQCGLTKTYGVGQTAISYSINSISTIGSLLICGAQAEAGAYQSSYIPTVASSATRIADFGSSSLQTTNANWSIFVDTYFVPYNEILNLLVNTTTSRFIGFYQSVNYFRCVGNAGAGIFAGRVMASTEGRKKVVLQNDGTDCIVFVNGVKLGGVNPSGVSALTGRASFQFQFYGGGSGVANKGTVNQIVQFDSKLSDAECITLSTL